MDRERELVGLIELREREFRAMMETPPNGASSLSDEWITAMMGLEELRDELAFLREGPSGPDALIEAPLKPRPHLNSGAIALPEPDEGEV